MTAINTSEANVSTGLQPDTQSVTETYIDHANSISSISEERTAGQNVMIMALKKGRDINDMLTGRVEGGIGFFYYHPDTIKAYKDTSFTISGAHYSS
jgi:hypothetical protein